MTGPARMPLCGRSRCNGWLGTDDEGRPIPCLDCRPHLRKTVETNDCDPATRR